MAKDKLQISQTILIPAPIEQVWSFLLIEENMKKWFQAEEFRIDASEGGSIKISINFEGVEVLVRGEIGLVYPVTKFYFTWYEIEGLDGDWFHNTSIEISLIKQDKGTTLNFKHTGFNRLPIESQEQIFMRYEEYWKKQIMPKRFVSLFLLENSR